MAQNREEGIQAPREIVQAAKAHSQEPLAMYIDFHEAVWIIIEF